MLAASAGSGLALGGDGTGRYRTATAETASVEQSVDAVGSVASATRRDASFSVAGTVATVDVAVGEQVAAGQTLATLDTASLQEAVGDAEASLADAQDQLDTDLASQTSPSTDETAAPSGATSPTGTVTPSLSTDPTDDSSATRPDGSTPPPTRRCRPPSPPCARHRRTCSRRPWPRTTALAASSSSVEASRAACTAFLDLVADDEEPQPTPSTPTEPPTEPLIDPTGAATGEQVVPEPVTDVARRDGDDTAVTAALAARRDLRDARRAGGDRRRPAGADGARDEVDEAVARLREVVTQALAGQGTTGEPTDAGLTTGGTVDSARDTTGTTGTSTPGTTATDPSVTGHPPRRFRHDERRRVGGDDPRGPGGGRRAAQAEVAVAHCAPVRHADEPDRGHGRGGLLAPGRHGRRRRRPRS